MLWSRTWHVLWCPSHFDVPGAPSVCAFLLLVASLSNKHNTHPPKSTFTLTVEENMNIVMLLLFSFSLFLCHLQISEHYWKNVLSFSDLFFLLYGGKNNLQDLDVLLLCEHSESAIVCYTTSLNVILSTDFCQCGRFYLQLLHAVKLWLEIHV